MSTFAKSLVLAPTNPSSMTLWVHGKVLHLNCCTLQAIQSDMLHNHIWQNLVWPCPLPSLPPSGNDSWAPFKEKCIIVFKLLYLSSRLVWDTTTPYLTKLDFWHPLPQTKGMTQWSQVDKIALLIKQFDLICNRTIFYRLLTTPNPLVPPTPAPRAWTTSPTLTKMYLNCCTFQAGQFDMLYDPIWQKNFDVLLTKSGPRAWPLDHRENPVRYLVGL